MAKLTSQSAIYYSARIVQRISLYLSVANTIIFWIGFMLIINETSISGSLAAGRKYKDSQATTETFHKIINMLSWNAGAAAAVAIIFSLLCLLIPRFRKHDKALIVDNLTLIIFCVISVILAQMLARSFYYRLTR